jgi:hypothetical protein
LYGLNAIFMRMSFSFVWFFICAIMFDNHGWMKFIHIHLHSSLPTYHWIHIHYKYVIWRIYVFCPYILFNGCYKIFIFHSLQHWMLAWWPHAFYENALQKSNLLKLRTVVWGLGVKFKECLAYNTLLLIKKKGSFLHLFVTWHIFQPPILVMFIWIEM